MAPDVLLECPLHRITHEFRQRIWTDERPPSPMALDESLVLEASQCRAHGQPTDRVLLDKLPLRGQPSVWEYASLDSVPQSQLKLVVQRSRLFRM
jgi:hypothetical protein